MAARAETPEERRARLESVLDELDAAGQSTFLDLCELLLMLSKRVQGAIRWKKKDADDPNWPTAFVVAVGIVTLRALSRLGGPHDHERSDGRDRHDTQRQPEREPPGAPVRERDELAQLGLSLPGTVTVAGTGASGVS